MIQRGKFCFMGVGAISGVAHDDGWAISLYGVRALALAALDTPAAIPVSDEEVSAAILPFSSGAVWETNWYARRWELRLPTGRFHSGMLAWGPDWAVMTLVTDELTVGIRASASEERAMGYFYHHTTKRGGKFEVRP